MALKSMVTVKSMDELEESACVDLLSDTDSPATAPASSSAGRAASRPATAASVASGSGGPQPSCPPEHDDNSSSDSEADEHGTTCTKDRKPLIEHPLCEPSGLSGVDLSAIAIVKPAAQAAVLAAVKPRKKKPTKGTKGTSHDKPELPAVRPRQQHMLETVVLGGAWLQTHR